jgi:hypothetical protein
LLSTRYLISPQAISTFPPLTPNILQNVEALAQNEGAAGECPAGGYWSTGKRTESQEWWFSKIDIKTGISVGIYPIKISAEKGYTIERVLTTAYDCDKSDNLSCLVCNRYVLK